MKYKILFISLFFGIYAESYAGPDAEPVEQDLETGIFYTINQKYGETNISEKNFLPENQENLSNLKTFVAQTGERHPGKAILASLPIEHAGCATVLSEAGFEMRTSRDFPLKWIIKNGSPIPEQFTHTAGAFALLYRQTGESGMQLLICADKNRKNRKTEIHLTWFPGGSVNFEEYTRSAAIREVKEEVGLDLDATSISKIYTCERLNTNEQGASNIMTLFMAKAKDGLLELDEAEIDHAHWVDIEMVLKAKPGGIITTEDGVTYEVTQLFYDVLAFYSSQGENKEGFGSDSIDPARKIYEAFYKVSKR